MLEAAPFLPSSNFAPVKGRECVFVLHLLAVKAPIYGLQATTLFEAHGLKSNQVGGRTAPVITPIRQVGGKTAPAITPIRRHCGAL